MPLCQHKNTQSPTCLQPQHESLHIKSLLTLQLQPATEAPSGTTPATLQVQVAAQHMTTKLL